MFLRLSRNLFIFISLHVYSAGAFLDTAINVKFPTENSGKILLYGDNHKEVLEDESQSLAVINFLQQNDIKSDRPTRILFEQPDDISQDLNFLNYLRTNFLQQQFQRTTLENIEQRCVSGAGLFLLQKDTNPSPKLNLSPDLYTNSCDRQCIITTVTFQDILDEYDLLKNRMATLYNDFSGDESIMRIYREKIMCADLRHECLREFLECENIQTDQSIYDLIFTENFRPRFAKILNNHIHGAFCPLLDLYILHRIITLSPDTDVIVITGNDHTGSVQSMLINLGAEIVCYHPSKENVPLANEQLDICTKQRSCILL